MPGPFPNRKGAARIQDQGEEAKKPHPWGEVSAFKCPGKLTAGTVRKQCLAPARG